MALKNRVPKGERGKLKGTPVHGAVDKFIRQATGVFGGGPKSGGSTKQSSQPRKTAAQQVKENISASEAAAKAQGFTRTADGKYVATSIIAKQRADAARNASKVAERSDVNKMAAASGTAVPKTAKVKKTNKRNAKRRVKGSK